MFEPNRKFLTSREVAEELRVSKATVTRLLASGELPSVKLGGRRLIATETINRLEKQALAGAVA
jgi:excisionase family DNA binding protein